MSCQSDLYFVYLNKNKTNHFKTQEFSFTNYHRR